MKEVFPYNLPIWRRAYSAESPDKKFIAEINPAYEVSMGNPTYGNLILSNGLNINNCNPSFIWSDNSKFLAVAQYTTNWLGGFGKQRLLIIDIDKQQAWQSPKLAYYIQPEIFKKEKLTITLNPFKTSKTITYKIPYDFKNLTKMKLPPNNSLRPVGDKE